MNQPQVNYRIHSNNKSELIDHFRTNERALEPLFNPYVIRLTQDSCRIAVFNVRCFNDARNQNSRFRQLLVEVNADIIGFVEFSPFFNEKWVAGLGYQYYANYSQLHLMSRYPIKCYTYYEVSEGRYLLDIMVADCRIILTHLNPSNQRDRVMALEKIACRYKHETIPVIIMGDMNYVNDEEIDGLDRSKYYIEYKGRHGEDYTREGLAYIDENFTDSFSGREPPPSTHWSGHRIDYIFHNNYVVSTGSYVYHTDTSDHIPVIMDFQIVETPTVDSSQLLDQLFPNIARKKREPKRDKPKRKSKRGKKK